MATGRGQVYLSMVGRAWGAGRAEAPWFQPEPHSTTWARYSSACGGSGPAPDAGVWHEHCCVSWLHPIDFGIKQLLAWLDKTDQSYRCCPLPWCAQDAELHCVARDARATSTTRRRVVCSDAARAAHHLHEVCPRRRGICEAGCALRCVHCALRPLPSSICWPCGFDTRFVLGRSGEEVYMAFLRKTVRLSRAARVESLVPTPATPVNAAAGDSLWLD